MDNIGGNVNDDDDEDFEAELAALAADDGTSYKSRRNGKRIVLYYMKMYIYKIENCLAILYIYIYRIYM